VGRGNGFNIMAQIIPEFWEYLKHKTFPSSWFSQSRDFFNASFVSAQDVAPIGEWREISLEIREIRLFASFAFYSLGFVKRL